MCHGHVDTDMQPGPLDLDQDTVICMPPAICTHHLALPQFFLHFPAISQFLAISQFFAIFHDFPQLLFACPLCVLVGALCVPCAEVLLLEASEGLVMAPQFPPQFSRNFWQFDLMLPSCPCPTGVCPFPCVMSLANTRWILD